MMDRRVVLHTIPVTRNGQRRPFRITLPKDAKRVTGIQVTLTPYLSDPEEEFDFRGSVHVLKHTPLAGEISIALAGSTGIFYRDMVRAIDWNAYYVDIVTSILINGGPLMGPSFKEPVPLSLSIPVDNHLVEGWYCDQLLKNEEITWTYDIKIYLWIEVSEKAAMDAETPKEGACAKQNENKVSGGGETINIEMNNLIVTSIKQEL